MEEEMENNTAQAVRVESSNWQDCMEQDCLEVIGLFYAGNRSRQLESCREESTIEIISEDLKQIHSNTALGGAQYPVGILKKSIPLERGKSRSNLSGMSKSSLGSKVNTLSKKLSLVPTKITHGMRAQSFKAAISGRLHSAAAAKFANKEDESVSMFSDVYVTSDLGYNKVEVRAVVSPRDETISSDDEDDILVEAPTTSKVLDSYMVEDAKTGEENTKSLETPLSMHPVRSLTVWTGWLGDADANLLQQSALGAQRLDGIGEPDILGDDACDNCSESSVMSKASMGPSSHAILASRQDDVPDEREMMARTVELRDSEAEDVASGISMSTTETSKSKTRKKIGLALTMALILCVIGGASFVLIGQKKFSEKESESTNEKNLQDIEYLETNNDPCDEEPVRALLVGKIDHRPKERKSSSVSNLRGDARSLSKRSRMLLHKQLISEGDEDVVRQRRHLSETHRSIKEDPCLPKAENVIQDSIGGENGPAASISSSKSKSSKSVKTSKSGKSSKCQRHGGDGDWVGGQEWAGGWWDAVEDGNTDSGCPPSRSGKSNGGSKSSGSTTSISEHLTSVAYTSMSTSIPTPTSSPTESSSSVVTFEPMVANETLIVPMPMTEVCLGINSNCQGYENTCCPGLECISSSQDEARCQESLESSAFTVDNQYAACGPLTCKPGTICLHISEPFNYYSCLTDRTNP